MEREENSTLGKVSIILSIIALLAILSKLALFLFSYFLSGGVGVPLLGFFLVVTSIIGILASFFGSCLGLAGIFQRTRVRKFAFIGTIISVALLCIYIFGGVAILLI